MDQLLSEVSIHDRDNIEKIGIRVNKGFSGSLSLEPLSRYKNVREIIIGGGSYSEIDMASIDRCTSLERFTLGNITSVMEIDMRPLLKAPMIRNIYLVNMKNLRNIRMDNIGTCKSLDSLMINCDNFVADFSTISKCKPLRNLKVSTRDDGIDLGPVANLHNLVSFTIIHHVKDVYTVYPIDCTSLLGLPDLIIFDIKTRDVLESSSGLITLPDVVSQVCGKTWPRVNDTHRDVIYKKKLDGDWRSIYLLLEEYASFFIPEYWPSLNSYILQTCGVENDRYHIDLSRCVIPSDLLKLVRPINVRRPRTSIIKNRLDERYVEMVEDYLNAGHSTKGFDIEAVTINEPRLVPLIPKVTEMRIQEIMNLAFFEYPIDGILDDNYYVHQLVDAVYGEQMLNEVTSSRAGNRRYTLTKSEIEEIERSLNDNSIETNWTYTTIIEYLFK